MSREIRMEDRRQINKVWDACNPIGQWFTYALIGSGKNSYVYTLHEGRQTEEDVRLIGGTLAWMGSKKRERRMETWHREHPIRMPD